MPPILSGITFSHAYFDRNNHLLRLTTSYDEKYRLYTPEKEISPYIKQAVILYEDKYFYYHPGINPFALIKASKNYLSGHPHPAGASTITMQLARLKYDINTKQITGKLYQIAAAIYLDLFYSKTDILTAYLNLAPYGGNIEGIGAATQIYFNKTAKKLSKIEAITLATIPQNPNKRGLNTKTGIQQILNMRTDLIKRWVKQYPNDKKLLTMANMHLQTNSINELPFYVPHFIHYIDSNFDYGSSNTDSYIQTTLDIMLQKQLEKTLKQQIQKRESFGIKNAAAILLNYKTMQVLSYIGSADYFDTNIFGKNDGVRAKRSPGSTLKPLIYASAADMGLIHGMTLLKDAKINFGVYAPENADNEFFGPILAHSALTHSRNIPAINLVKQIGAKNFLKILSDSGVSDLKNANHYGISVALGGAEVSMLELADIYATMANLGMRKEIITNTTQKNHDIQQILSPEAFFLVLDMLSQQSIPTKKIPFTKQTISPIKHYWKTGTSSSFRDAWTAGIFGDYVLIVWVGNFDGKPNNSFSGAQTAAPIYFALANTIINYFSHTKKPVKNNNFLYDDLNITEIDMCDIVGGIANEYCPKIKKSYFIPGKSPLETSSIYRQIPIDNKTGLRACHPDKKNTHMEIYEFWDPEYIDMFKHAGITKNTPPPYMSGCDLDNQINNIDDSDIIIISPANSTRIVIVSDSDSQNILLKAITSNVKSKISWFLDDNFIGTSISGETFKYNIPMGDHKIRATNENNISAYSVFQIVK